MFRISKSFTLLALMTVSVAVSATMAANDSPTSKSTTTNHKGAIPSSSSSKSSSASGMIASTVDWATTKMIDVLTEVLNATTSPEGRAAKSNFDGAYAMWNPGASGKFDVLSLIPTLLIVGIGIMLLPVILSCFTQIIAPLSYGQGRKRRDVGDEHPFSSPLLILDLLSTFHKAMDKYNK